MILICLGINPVGDRSEMTVLGFRSLLLVIIIIILKVEYSLVRDLSLVTQDTKSSNDILPSVE